MFCVFRVSVYSRNQGNGKDYLLLYPVSNSYQHWIMQRKTQTLHNPLNYYVAKSYLGSVQSMTWLQCLIDILELHI